MDDRITVFVSHTTHQTVAEREDGPHLLHLVREVLFTSRLGEFLAVADLQAGSDWEARLDAEAGGAPC